MSLKKRPEKWFLIQWNSSGSRAVVSSQAINPAQEAKVGAVVTIEHEGELQKADIIGSSRDRELLEQQISPHAYVNDGAGTSSQNDGANTHENRQGVDNLSVQKDEPRDYSPSGSSWAPSDDQASSEDDDDDEVENKKVKMERFSRSYSRTSSKILKPSNRVDPINVSIKNNRKRKIEKPNTKKELTNNAPVKKSLPDSTKKNTGPIPVVNRDTVTVNCKLSEIMSMSDNFSELFKIVNVMKQGVHNDVNQSTNDKTMVPMLKNEDNTLIETEDNGEKRPPGERNESDVSNRSPSEESNRSDDNVLITNKYNNISETNKKVSKPQIKTQIYREQVDDWVPIGTGKTLIHKDKFRKVNWKSYTIATRTLLLALFPRRILATHSLTGKRSPAFQNKPAKMCLDPKIVSDVIIEITERFRVKENLVRSIITTKCADECKMFKTRMQRKSVPVRNRENVPPKQEALAENALDVSANQTC